MKGQGGKRLLIILFWLFLWHLLALWVGNKIMLATPLEALGALLKMLPEKEFWQAVLGSLLRITAGFLWGAAAGAAFAVAGSRFRPLEELLSPVMGLCKAVPVASFVVLFLIWWGSSFLAVAVCFLMVFPNIYLNMLAGLKSADRRLLEMAEVFRLPFLKRFFYIYRPALKPFLLSGLKISLGMSWKSGVAAEVIGMPDCSIGERLYLAKVYLETDRVFAWTAAVILLSFGFERLVLGLAGRFFAWKPGFAAAQTPDRGDGAGEKAKPVVCSKVDKAYGKEPVIRGLSRVYEPGKIYCLTSPSGSGKTTLFRLLCGLEQPDSGEISGPERFCVLFQEDRLCEDYSALENVELVTGGGEERPF